jgi:hypothetical protein
VWYVPNEGTREKPAYGAKQALRADGKQVQCGGGDAGPAVADWDADGKLDLLVGGGDGAVTFYRNTSDDKSKPVLAAGQVLIPASPAIQRDPGAADAALKHGMRAKLHVVDYNGDGKLDLLLGDFSSVESKKELTDEQRAKQQDAEAKLKQLTDEQQRLAVAPDGETPEQRKERQKALRNVQREIIETSRQAMTSAPSRRWEQHGYVWLYLRKDAARTAAAQGGAG